MVLAGYFDDSGTDATSKVITVAGWVAPVDRWVASCEDWRGALRDNGLTHFRMSEFENLKGKFSTWQKDARYFDLIKRLRGIIERTAMFGVGAAVMREDYDAITRDDKAEIGNPFIVCARGCLELASIEIERRGYKGPWQAVFESGSKGAGDLLRHCSAEHWRERYQMTPPTTENKKETCRLQAADILAYETWKQVPRTLGTELRRPRKLALALAYRTPLFGDLFLLRHLKDLADVIRRPELPVRPARPPRSP